VTLNADQHRDLQQKQHQPHDGALERHHAYDATALFILYKNRNPFVILAFIGRTAS
jgi:hypothetical protein